MAEFNYTLLEDRVAIKPDVADEKSETGLFKPPTANKTTVTGTVIAVGNGLIATESGKLLPMFVKVGQRVIMEPFGWEPFGEYVLGRQAAIKCIIR